MFFLGELFFNCQSHAHKNIILKPQTCWCEFWLLFSPLPQTINQSSDKIRVRDLQIVTRCVCVLHISTNIHWLSKIYVRNRMFEVCLFLQRSNKPHERGWRGEDENLQRPHLDAEGHRQHWSGIPNKYQGLAELSDLFELDTWEETCWWLCVCLGSEDRSEDSTESPASPAAGGPTETRPHHERHLPGQTPLHPKAVHTGRHVSLQNTVK